jgi:hypothetical protein
MMGSLLFLLLARAQTADREAAAARTEGKGGRQRLTICVWAIPLAMMAICASPFAGWHEPIPRPSE